MSVGYRNRKKAIRRLRKEFRETAVELLKHYAAQYNDRWEGLAARLALRDRGISW